MNVRSNQTEYNKNYSINSYAQDTIVLHASVFLTGICMSLMINI
jgi:hypothetical protein